MLIVGLKILDSSRGNRIRPELNHFYTPANSKSAKKPLKSIGRRMVRSSNLFFQALNITKSSQPGIYTLRDTECVYMLPYGNVGTAPYFSTCLGKVKVLKHNTVAAHIVVYRQCMVRFTHYITSSML